MYVCQVLGSVLCLECVVVMDVCVMLFSVLYLSVCVHDGCCVFSVF